MAQETISAISGLVTDPSETVRTPGALSEAKNVDLERPGVVETRRGLELYGQSVHGIFPSGGAVFSNSDRRAVQLFDTSPDGNPADVSGQWENGEFFQTNQLTGGFQSTGLQKSPPNGAAKVRFLKTDAGVFVTAEDGVYRAGTTLRAGLLPPAFFTAVPVATGPGVLPAESAIAYRCVNIRIESNGRLRQSAPSGRFVLTTSGTPAAGRASIAVQIALSADARVGDVIALYRSRDATPADGPGLGLPTDEMFLVGSVVLDSAAVTLGSIVITDDKSADEVPALESNQAPLLLYTSPTAEGIAQSNDPPPVASDIELFQNHVFFAQPKREFLSFFVFPLNSFDNGGTDNIVAGDTITINGTSTVVLTSANNPIPANGEFWNSADIVNDYTVVLGVSESMNEVLVSLIAAAINATSDQHGVYAQVAERASSLTRTSRAGVYWPADPRRRIVLRSITEAPFSVAFSSSVTGANAPFRDEQGDLDGRTLNSQTDFQQNGLAFSKQDQPDAVPLLNTFRVGADTPIVRIKRLVNSLMIFKRDGQFRVTGTDPSNFRVTEVDPTLQLVAPETLAELDGILYGLFDQGVMAISQSSKRLLSAPIDFDIRNAIREISTSEFTLNQTLFDYAVGGAYENDLKYFFGIPPGPNEYPQSLFVYCLRTSAWSTWQTPATCVANDSLNRLIMGNPSAPWINRQRRTYTLNDFADRSEVISIDTVVSQTELEIRFTAGATRAFAPAEGDAIVSPDAFGNIAQGIVRSAVQTSATEWTVTVDTPVGNAPSGYTTGAAIIHKSIETRIELSPLYGGRLGAGKQFDQVALAFATLRIPEGRAGFATDISSVEEQVLIDSQWRALNGFEPWYAGAYAGTPRPGVVITQVPRNKQRASQIAISWECAAALAQWRMQGLVATFATETEVIKR